MSMYSIIELGNSDYLCICRIQDGVERWKETIKEKAVHSLINAAKVLNWTTITEKDIHFKSPISHHTQSREKVVEQKSFRDELCNLINCHSRENGSNTPDFILAEYLTDCLEAFDKATKRCTDRLAFGDL